MKFMWFHLMPYTELPDDFREKHPSVWVDIHSSLFDPRRAHHMYNDFMDELEYAADCGFDAICVNEHHSNGYGLMPSPNLIASSLSRRTTDTAICVMGNSLALYNPPTRVAEEFAMIDCISGGRLIAGFPVGTPMDDCFAYGQNPSPAPRALLRSARPGDEGLAAAGHLRVQRPLQPAALRQHLAAPDPAPASAGVDPRRRLDRDLAVVRRDGLRLFAICRTTATRSARPRWTASGPRWTRLGKDRNPYRAGFAQTVAVAESREQAIDLYTEAAEYFFGRCLHVDPRFAAPPGYTTEATMRFGLHQPGQRRRRAFAGAADRDEGPGRGRVSGDRLAGRGGGADRRTGDQPARRQPDAAHAVRQHEQGADQVQHAAVRRTGDAEAAAQVRRMRAPLVAEADGHRAARRIAGIRAIIPRSSAMADHIGTGLPTDGLAIAGMTILQGDRPCA